MPIPIEYTVDDVIAMLKNDKSFGGANIYNVHRLINHTVMHSVDEELGTIDNLSRNQLETEGESTVLRGPNKLEKWWIRTAGSYLGRYLGRYNGFSRC